MIRKGASKRKLLRIVAIMVAVVVACGILITINVNGLLTNIFYNGFKNTLVAEVYELKFKHLEANLFTGSVRVIDVEMYPRDKPGQLFTYINSSFRLKAQQIVLKNVDLLHLLFSKTLDLSKIEIVQPYIDFTLADHRLIFFPFREGSGEQQEQDSVPAIQSYVVKELNMLDAHFHVMNVTGSRELNMGHINFALKEMTIDREPGRDKISYQHVDFSLGELTGHLKNKELRYVHFKDFAISVDSLHLEESADTLIYHFSDAISSMKDLDIQTADSLFHITMESYHLLYKEKSLEFTNLSFTPNLSDVAMAKRYPYRKEIFAGKASSLRVTELNFDSLLYYHKIAAKEILLDDISGSIYKDLTKPFPPNHRPQYLAQQVQAYSIPISIQHIQVTQANLVNTEVTPDGGIGKANINRGTIDIENITNYSTTEKLVIRADAYIENAAHVNLQLQFNYDQSQYSLDGKIDPFEMSSLNSITNSYAPARVKEGKAEGITFSGTVYRTYSTGTMKFLYHDLTLDMELTDKAKWKSIIIAMAANTLINNSNPSSPNQPTRVVRFRVERDMRTGYISMLVKSVFDGVKESLIMSKENKKKYRSAKENLKSKAKEEKKD